MYEIRQATPDDALAITLVNVYTWKTAYQGLMPESIIDERIAQLPTRAQKTRETLAEGGHCLVATTDGVVIGFCRYGASRNEAYPGEGEIYALYVLKGFSGIGVGRALLQSGMDALRTFGYQTAFIHCLQGNPSRTFYERMGGVVIGQHTDELFGVTMVEDILHFQL